MNQPQTSSGEVIKTDNDSFDRKGLTDGGKTSSSGMLSCYEINVHENFSSDSNTSKGSGFFYARPKLMVKVKKVGGSKDDKESNYNTHLFVENLKRIANPLIESYYPFLEEHQIKNITIEINLNLNSDGKESEQQKENTCMSVGGNSVENFEEGSSKKLFESASNDSQGSKGEKKLAVSSFSKLRKKLKRQIIQDMLSKKDGEFKDVQWKDVDEPLHFHHHEHHHHYYVDASKLKDESEFSLLQSVSNTPVHWGENKENECKTTNTLNSEVDVKEKERSSYLYDCSRHHPVNFMLHNNCNVSNLTFVRKSKEEYMKFADKCSYRSAPVKPLKKASSVDFLGPKKSDYIIFHNYSDTEVSKCDSEESGATYALSSLATNMKKNAIAEDIRSKLLGGESEVVAGKAIQGNNRNCSALKKSSDEKCHERKNTSTEKANKKLGKRSENKLKALEERSEDSKGESETLVEKEEIKSEPIPTTSSEIESVDVKTDKEMSDENATSTTGTTSEKDTATVVETSEVGSSNSDEKYSDSKSSKSAGSSEDKMKSYSRRKVDSNGQAGVKSKAIFGISGSNRNKGVFHCYYTCRRNRGCNITLTLEENRKRATESSKSIDSSYVKIKEEASAKQAK